MVEEIDRNVLTSGLPGSSYVPRYDVSSDGQKFVVVETLEEESPPVVRVVQNWFAEFRDRDQDYGMHP